MLIISGADIQTYIGMEVPYHSSSYYPDDGSSPAENEQRARLKTGAC